MEYKTIIVKVDDGVCRIAFDRPDTGNAINTLMIDEFSDVLQRCEHVNGFDGEIILAVVIEGTDDVFSTGGDFEAVSENGIGNDPKPLYDLWMKLAHGPFVTISLVTGRTNAGGVGFVAASDIVIAGEQASFSLSEMLFGLFPACVLPFLIRRVGRQKAHYMTLVTQHVTASDGHECGLVDVVAKDAEAALGQHLNRVKYLKKGSIARYKSYMSNCYGDPVGDERAALHANRSMFSDPDVIAGIQRYVTELKLPWEE